MNTIIISVVLLGVLGIAIGLLLGVAGKFFSVEVDERVEQVRECLPGNNCGGCGFPGCDGLAEAIVAGRRRSGGREDGINPRWRGWICREDGGEGALRWNLRAGVCEV